MIVDLQAIERDAVNDLAAQIDALVKQVPEGNRSQFRREATAELLGVGLALGAATGELVGRVKERFGPRGARKSTRRCTRR